MRVSLIIFIALIFLGCEKEKSQEPKKELIRSVKVERVTASSGIEKKSFTGISKSSTESKISFRVSGMIERVYVKVGDSIKKGKMIAKLDDTQFKLKVNEAKSNLNRIKAELKSADSSYERVKALYVNANASKSDLDSARANLDVLKSSLKTAQSQVKQAKLQLSYTSLISPISGVIARVPATVNENIKAGEAIVTLNSVDDLEIEVNIPESFISKIKKGDIVDVNILDKAIKGVVLEVSISSNRTIFPVTIKLSEKFKNMLSGVVADVTFIFVNRDSNILISPYAIGKDVKGNFVFVAKEQKNNLLKIEKKYVKLGKILGERVEVLDGLSENDLIVTAGVTKIKDGQIAKVFR